RSGSDRRGFASDKLVHDPALAGWRFGVDLVAQQGPRASTFRVRSVEGGKTLARAVPLTPARSAAILGTWSGQPFEVLDALRGADPLNTTAPDAEHRRLVVRCEGPTLVMIS